MMSIHLFKSSEQGAICLAGLANYIEASAIIPIYSESFSIWGNHILLYGCVIFALLHFCNYADSYSISVVLYVICGQETTLVYLGLLLSNWIIHTYG